MKDKQRKELGKKLDQRKEFLQKVYDFAVAVLDQVGTVTHREVHSSNTHVIEFAEIEGFRIDSNTGMNMYGDGSLTLRFKYSQRILLQLHFYGSFNAYDESTQMASTVRTFYDDPKWQQSILNLIDNSKEIIRVEKQSANKVVKKQKSYT